MTNMRIVISKPETYDFDRIEQLLNTVGIPYTLEFDKDGVEEDMVSPTMCDGAQEQAIEPENIDKLGSDITPFVRAQLSTKNQMILRNVLAILSSIGVLIVFILEKLGIM